MLTGAILEECRRVTGCAQEGNRKITRRLPEGYLSIQEGYRSVGEGYRSVREGYRSLHKSAKVEIPMYGRDQRVYWWVTGGR